MTGSEEDHVIATGHQLGSHVEGRRFPGPSPAILHLDPNPKGHVVRRIEVPENLVGRREPYSRGERVGLGGVDDLKPRAEVGHHGTDSEGYTPQGL